ncbi:hypothetical protein ACFL6U_12180 [Planctomycetota bacterium]
MMPPTQNNPPQNQQQTPPPPPEPKYSFRWSAILGVPLAALAFFWVLNGLEPSFQFEDLLSTLGVLQRHKYVRLGCLGVLLIAVILIVKTLKHHSD